MGDRYVSWPRERGVANRQLHRQRRHPALFTVQPAIASDGTLTYTPAPDANGPPRSPSPRSTTAAPPTAASNTSTTATFTITVAPVNDAPSFNAGPDYSAAPTARSATTVPGWATGITPGPADESSQNVTFSVSSTNGGLFAVQPAIAPDGTLTYTPNLLALGSSTVTVRLRDDGGNANGGSDTSATQTFTINILL